MSQRTDLDAKRKKLVDLTKKKVKIDTEIKGLKAEIVKGELACNHQWEKKKYDKALDTMVRICEFCGKFEKADTFGFR